MPLKCNRKVAFCAILAASAVGGCGVDDVQLNGKIFDAMGVNTGSVKKEVTMRERQPLVVPPGLDKLPEPGSGKASQPNLAELQDHDAKRQVSRADLERQQAEFCKKNYDDAKVHGDQNADLAEGPLGRCQGSVLSAIKKWNDGGDADAEAQ